MAGEPPSTPVPGAYRLRRRIGEGGCGEVWEAEQHALSRRVAVKRIRADLYERMKEDPALRLWRETEFRQEALTTAHLEHPNIVPVHDLGIDEAGRPLLAMKLVRGRAWGDLIRADFEKLTVADRLERHLPTLLSVAQAVAFAHSRGIVHRDLKPAQVMVGEFGEVMVMDWGLAVYLPEHDARPEEVRPRELRDELPTAETATSPAGTFAFMAPEQTRPTAEGIGPATDVFLLGGTLYYLLTGTPPHWSDDARAVFAMARGGIVPPPQTRRPEHDLPPELCAICMKALAQQPAQRHSSALAFLDEVRGFMTGASRRRQSEALHAEAAREADSAPVDEARARELLAKLAEAVRLWPDNRPARALAARLLAQRVRRQIEGGDLNAAGLQLEELSAQPEADREELSRLDAALAQALARRRRLARQRVHFATAAALCAAAALGAGWLAFLRTAEARNIEARERARVEIQRDRAEAALAEAGRARDASARLVAFMIDDLRKQLTTVDPTLASLDEVAKRAAEHYAAVLASATDPTELAEARSGLLGVATIFTTQGNSALAAEQIARVVEWLEAAPPPADADRLRELARAASQLANVRLAMGDPDGASQAADRARAAYQALPRQALDEQATRKGFAVFKVIDGQLARHAGNSSDALRLFEQARDELAPLADGQDGAGEVLTELLAARRYCGSAYAELGRFEDALGEFRAAEALLRRQLAGPEGDPPQLRALLAASLAFRAQLHLRLGERAEAAAALDEQLSISEELVASDPTQLFWLNDLKLASVLRGDLHTANSDTAAAETSYLRFRELATQLADRDPNNMTWRADAAIAHNRLGALYKNLGRFDDAQAELFAYRDGIAELRALDPGNRRWRRELSTASNSLGILMLDRRQFDEALAHASDALDATLELLAIEPANTDWRLDEAAIRTTIARALHVLGRDDESRESYRLAIAIYEAQHAARPENLPLRLDVAQRLRESAVVEASASRWIEAADRLARARDLAADEAGNYASARAARMVAASLAAWVAMERGDGDSARALAAEAASDLQALDAAPAFASERLTVRLELAILDGGIEAARDSIAAWDPEVANNRAFMLRALLVCALGDEGCRDAVEQALPIAPRDPRFLRLVAERFPDLAPPR
ncbi:MAG: serine/threonine-protein kinase [Candidatus Sumerlaeia bacterium]|nr:serine/threonine-protein kinase [Candidatus Sumerlaeia bacterium]